MKKTLITTLVFFVLLFVALYNPLFSEEPFVVDEYNMFFADSLVKDYVISDEGITSPLLTNILTVSLFNMYQFEYKYYYSFNWNENNLLSTQFFMTYIDSIEQTNLYSGAPLGTVADTAGFSFISVSSGKPIWDFSYFNLISNLGLTFSTSDTLNIDTCSARMSEFITVIKKDNKLFDKYKFATNDTANQCFVFGIGYISTLAFEDATVEHGIDKTRPICFVGSSSLPDKDNKWDFCYSYADEPITELNCLSNYDAILEPSELTFSQIHPNPTNENNTVLTLELAKSCDIKIVLSDILGQELLQIYDGFAEKTFVKSINTESLAKGIYYIKIFIGNEAKIEKLIKN